MEPNTHEHYEVEVYILHEWTKTGESCATLAEARAYLEKVRRPDGPVFRITRHVTSWEVVHESTTKEDVPKLYRIEEEIEGKWVPQMGVFDNLFDAEHTVAARGLWKRTRCRVVLVDEVKP